MSKTTVHELFLPRLAQGGDRDTDNGSTKFCLQAKLPFCFPAIMASLTMKTPRGKPRGIWGLKQLELHMMKLFIVSLFSLFLYILANNVFITAFAYGIYVVPISPKFSTPQSFFD